MPGGRSSSRRAQQQQIPTSHTPNQGPCFWKSVSPGTTSATRESGRPSASLGHIELSEGPAASSAGWRRRAAGTRPAGCGPGGLDPKLLHGAVGPGPGGGLFRDGGGPAGRPSLIARIPVARILGDPEEESWSPSLSNLEKVVVTDVTSNFLTVTIKESSTDQGFFKEKR